MIDRNELARMIDHTLLKPEATESDVRRLCQEAVEHGFATVCINPVYAPLAARILEGTRVRVCTVAGFPLGASLTEVKAFEARAAVDSGAAEIDVVMNVGALKAGDHRSVVRDIEGVVKAVSGDALVKVILET